MIEQGGGKHSHVFLGEGHAEAERRSWAVIWLCSAMMALEIGGGLAFGSIALVADGMHMSTHAGALLLAAMAYRYARRHVHDPRFTFGTGKFGDLAGFTSAVVLAMIALLIGYEAVARLFAPERIDFREAIPIAVLGLGVNLVSAWLLSGGHGHGGHSHGHSHGGHAHGGHAHDHDHDHEERHVLQGRSGTLTVSIFEQGVPPRFRVAGCVGPAPVIETVREDGARRRFALVDRGGYWESLDAVPEPHAFVAEVHLGEELLAAHFAEDGHGEAGHGEGGAIGRDNNLRAAVVHVFADAMVSVLVIGGLLLARAFGWLWMDPLAGIVGAVVIASWAYGLIRDTGGILLDMHADRAMADRLRVAIEADGDEVADLHIWRLGPGHLGAILAVRTATARTPDFYRSLLAAQKSVSHVTVEVEYAG
jgi:cation diffusion facilitator family transporter